MVQVTRSFLVDRPADQVVAYLADFTHAEEWDPGTVACRRLDAGPIEVGARWQNVSKVLGRRVELTYRLRTLDAGTLTFVGTNPKATSTDNIVVGADGSSRSRVTYTATIEFNGSLRFLEPIIKRYFERLGDATVTGIVNAVGRL